MASIRDYAFTEGTVASATPSADMPIHESGDLLLAFHNADAVTINLPSGWTDIVQINGTGHGCRAFYKIATSSSETLTGSQSASDTYTITVLAIKDFNASTPIDTYTTRTTDDSSVPFAGASITTSSNNCLVFSYISTDGGLGPTCEPGWTNLVTGDAGANSGGLAYTVKKASGTLSAPNWYGQTNDNTTSITIAINDDGNLTSLPGYILPGDSPGEFIEHGYWITGGANNAWGNSYPTALSHASIGSKSTAYDASAVTADTGVNPYWGSQYLTPAASTNGAAVGGSQCNYSSAVNYTGKILLTSYLFATPRDYVDLSTSTDSGQYGLLWVASDGTNYKAWSIGTKGDLTTKSDGRVLVGIQVDQTTSTTIASSGSLSASTVDRHLCLAQGRYGAVAYRHSCFFLADEFTICGGTSTNTLNFINLEFILNNSLGNFPIMIREGSAATFFAPIKIGGTDPVFIQVNLRTIQYRTRADGVDYFDWHVDENKVGFEFHGQASDVIHFTNCVFTSGSSTYWRFNASHSSSASIDFSGTTVVNQLVTLQSTVSLTSVSFVQCSEIVLNGGDLSGCTFKNQRSGNNTGAVAFTSATEGNGVTFGTFTDNNDGDLGHSIRITAAGTYTFSGHQFSGGGLAEFSFHTQNDIDAGNDEIDHTAHGYTTGDAIYYQDQGGSDSIGLTDGNLYYVRAVTADSLAFYSSKANAQSDTSRINLTDGSTGETHYIYSAKADVYNASGGAVTINITNGGDTPTIRNSNGSSTTIQNAVTMQVTVKDSSGNAIENAQVWIQKESDDTDIGHPGNPFTLPTGNNQGDSDLVVNETPPADIPSSGWIRVKTGMDEQLYRYASKSGSTFTFNSEVTGTDNGTGTATVINETGIGSKNIVEGDTIRNTTSDPDEWAVVLSVSANAVTTTPLSAGATWNSASYSIHKLAVNYKSGDTASIPLMNEETNASGVATESYNYVSDKDILVRIRLASGSPDYLPYSTAGTITSSGYSLTATLQTDTIKS